MPEIEQKVVLITIIAYYLLWLLMGVIFYLKQPKEINIIYGYRTSRSMKNIKNWNFANKLSARYFIIVAHLSFVISLLLFFFLKDLLTFTPLFLTVNFLYCFSLVLIILLVEAKLKRFEKTQS